MGVISLDSPLLLSMTTTLTPVSLESLTTLSLMVHDQKGVSGNLLGPDDAPEGKKGRKLRLVRAESKGTRLGSRPQKWPQAERA